MKPVALLAADATVASFATDDGPPWVVQLSGPQHRELYEFRGDERPAACMPIVAGSDEEAALMQRLDEFLRMPKGEPEAIALLRKLQERARKRTPPFALRVQTVEAAEDELRRAMLAGDVEALERLLDEALMFTTLDGRVIGKADDLTAHRTGLVQFSRLEPSERRVALHPGVAVVSVKMSAEGVLDGVVFDQRLRFTRYWVQQGGAWRLVGGHVSLLAA